MEETLVVRREQHVPAPPAVVFAFLTDPEKILRVSVDDCDIVHIVLLY